MARAGIPDVTTSPKKARKNGTRTSLRTMGVNAIRIGQMVQRDGIVDLLPLAMSELKATLSSSSLDWRELNS